MSATMQQGLASLLVRKTEEGRAKAAHDVEAWKRAIEAVRQAERMAEHKITLPNEQVQGVQQAAKQVRTANYVLAVYLANKATTEHSSVMATATGALQEEVSRLKMEEYYTQDKVRSAIKERDSAIAELKSKRDSEFLEFHERRPLWLRVRLYDDPPLMLTTCISVALAVAFYDYTNFIRSDSVVYAGSSSFIRFALSVVVFFGSLPAVYKFMGWLREAHLDASVRFARAAREREFQKASQAAENRRLKVMPEFEESIRRSEALRKKAEEALRWLQAHAQNPKGGA